MNVSVIIPARNAASTLAETLACLHAQSFVDWEAIVVDDGSTDATAAVVSECAAGDARVRLLRQAAAGVSAARNAGLAQAVGRWVMFLDADDWVAPAYLARMVALLDARPDADLAFCGFRRVLPDGSELAEKPGSPMNFPGELARAPFEVLARRCPLAIHAVLVRRTVVLEAGGFDPEQVVHEDWDLWLRIARMGAVFVGLPELLALYRVRARSATSDPVRLAREAAAVIMRARRPDSRPARVDPRYAAGLQNDDDPDEWCAYVTLYLAGVAAGAGLGPREVLEAQARWPHFRTRDRQGGAFGAIVAGLALGAQLPHHRLIEAWPTLAPHLAEICAHLDAVSGGAGAGAGVGTGAGVGARVGPGVAVGATCQAAVELQLLATSPPEASRALASLHGFCVTLNDGDGPAPLPWIVPAPHADRVFVRVLAAENVMVGALLVSTSFPLSPRDLARALLAAWQTPPAGPGAVEIAALRARHVPALREAATMAPTATGAAAPCDDDGRAGRLVARWRRVAEDGVRAACDADGESAAGAPVVAGHAPRAEAVARRRGGARRGDIVGVVPVLAYHAVAADGPPTLARWRVHPRALAEQLQLLRRRGYHAITSRELLTWLGGGAVLRGHPILLTFDDGYRDFIEVAWPLLRRHGFVAELFVVTDKVGGAADWDSPHGPPASLMNWQEIQEVHRQGAAIGSHLATHRRADTLSMEELVEEAARSRFTLEARLRAPVRSVAMPFGVRDERLLRALGWSGYEIGFSIEDGLVTPGMPPLALPRVEIAGHDDLDAFARKVERLQAPQHRHAATASRDTVGGDTTPAAAVAGPGGATRGAALAALASAARPTLVGTGRADLGHHD